MALQTEWVRYGERDQYLGFAARVERAAPPLPAVIVIQEAGGVDAHIEDVARRIAAAGYFAFAPDLFSVDGVRPPALARERMAEMMAFFNSLPIGSIGEPAIREAAMAARPADEASRLRETVARIFTGGVLQLDQYLPQLHATASHLRRDNAATRGQKLAVMGFCMGGGLSALFACHDPELAAAAIFYGLPPDRSLLANVRCPVVGFYGGNDRRITDTVPAFAEAMKQAGKSFAPHIYEGAAHAFFNDDRSSYQAAAARDSYARLLDLFRRQLG